MSDKETPPPVSVIRSEIEKVVEKDSEALEEIGKTKRLSDYQVKLLSSPTPKRMIYTRPAKGGGAPWRYAPVPWVEEMLNTIFNYAWSFSILDVVEKGEEVIVKGRLVIHLNDGTEVHKEDFGMDEHIKNKDKVIVSSFGNVCKAAKSDCLKRCAAQLGIGLDLYNDDLIKYREQKVVRQAEDTKKVAAALTEKALGNNPTNPPTTNADNGEGGSDA